jgi:hypothetical protein
MDALGPTARNKVGSAGHFIASRKHGLELGFGHLVDWLRSFRGHVGHPVYGGNNGM